MCSVHLEAHKIVLFSGCKRTEDTQETMADPRVDYLMDRVDYLMVRVDFLMAFVPHGFQLVMDEVVRIERLLLRRLNNLEYRFRFLTGTVLYLLNENIRHNQNMLRIEDKLDQLTRVVNILVTINCLVFLASTWIYFGFETWFHDVTRGNLGPVPLGNTPPFHRWNIMLRTLIKTFQRLEATLPPLT